METLPTAGLPPLMRNWSEYVWLLNLLIETGFIKSIRELWWDVRPHQNFGTVELRICDMPPSLDQVLGITALIQCLVHDLSEEIDRGTYQFDCHPFLIRQNKWRACRYGMDARLVDPRTHTAEPARDVVHRLAEKLHVRARELDCTTYLERVHEMADQPTGSAMQLQIFQETGNLAEVVRRMIAFGENQTTTVPRTNTSAGAPD
jgi:carboxylate-amine ligase